MLTSPAGNATPAPDDDAFAGRRVIVMGLGRFGGGVGVARWLAERGARVVVTDLADESQLAGSMGRLADLPISYHLGGHDSAILDDAHWLIVSPAVPKERSEFFREAARRHIAWTTEINLFLERCRARIVGVTGTAGKSTTTAMIHAVLERARGDRRTYMGGNIGGSLLGEVAAMSPDDIVVLELSSVQLADLSPACRRPDVAVMVTLWPHHIDRHGTFASYCDAKLNMVRGAAPGTPLVLGFDDVPPAFDLTAVADQYGIRMLRASDRGEAFTLPLVGEHNQVNARCAAAACAELGVDGDVVRAALEQFGGLAHRLQWAARIGGVDYYNDSKATSPRAAAASLRAFDRPVVALVGGHRGSAPIDPLVDALVDRARVVVCFGETGPMMHDALIRTARTGRRIAVHQADGLGQAFGHARRTARAGDVVLLAPGFASYDAFADYEQRGEAFLSLVHAVTASAL